jgi:hypothetical protein
VALTVIPLRDILYQRWKAEISMYSVDSRVDMVGSGVIGSAVLEPGTVPLKHDETSAVSGSLSRIRSYLVSRLRYSFAIPVLFFIRTGHIRTGTKCGRL